MRALMHAGASPVLIPLGLTEATLQDLVPRLDGILFSGGGDIHPRFYGGEPHPRVDLVDEDRDRVETNLLHIAIEQRMPFFGICRGHQLVNVALGGSLYADIADQHANALKHDSSQDQERGILAHPVQIESESLLAPILGTLSLEVNSSHHQGINRLAPGLKATAHTSDGILEAIELPDHPFGLAVQWHPERLQERAPMRALFRAFVHAADTVNKP